MNYEQAMDYLKGLTKFGINLGLERIKELLKRLDNPERKTKFIHIGGTNGKGSTASMLASILGESGKRIGLFTSPHLHAYTERIKINGTEISKEEIAQMITEIRPHLDAMVQEGFEHPTEFEVSTALALWYFAKQNIDLAVMEVGMGGEIDSTNVITPLISIITNVSMDHMEYLGETREEIAQVKAGIIKPGVQVITAVRHLGAQAVITARAKQERCPLWLEGRDFWAEPKEFSHRFQVFDCTVSGQLLRKLKISLLGSHQLVNASMAVAAAVYLGVAEEQIRVGLFKAKWPCRLETVKDNPLVIIDAAHNVDGMKVLKDTLLQYWPDEKKVLVLGMLADKERRDAVAEIVPYVDKVVVTKPNSPRAGAWQQVADYVGEYGKEVVVEESIGQAVDTAIKMADSTYLILITGSIYMVAEARAHLLNLN